jgi:hypothetical protein
MSKTVAERQEATSPNLTKGLKCLYPKNSHMSREKIINNIQIISLKATIAIYQQAKKVNHTRAITAKKVKKASK